MKNKIFLILSSFIFLSHSLFAESTESEVVKKKNVVEININLNKNGEVDVSKESKKLLGDPDKRFFIIKDSDTGNPVPKANVEIDHKWDVITNREGKADLPDEVDDGEHSMVVTKEGIYVKTESAFTVFDGEISTPPQISVPKAVDYERFKIVLDWGQYPLDLDSHIFSNRYHVYYQNKNEGNLDLDRDDTDSYGPETVTIRDLDRSPRYQYYVFDYSNKDDSYCNKMSFSGAQVRVFYNNDLVETFTIKPDQHGIWWHVFDLDEDHKIVKVDTVSRNR